MDIEAARSYLNGKPEAEETYPFGPETRVFKIRDKMFATLGVRNGQGQMNLKCDPDEAVELRDLFEAVIPGWHMNKRHWNTVILDGSIPRGEIERMIDRSFGLVVKSLKKSSRVALEAKYGHDEIFK